jgi:hypothetical protein
MENSHHRSVEDPEAWIGYSMCLRKFWKSFPFQRLLVLFSFSYFLFQLALVYVKKLND